MKVNRSPSDAPSGERSAAARANVAFGDSACLARGPSHLAGDKRKIRFI
jgi:hypothetical protein